MRASVVAVLPKLAMRIPQEATSIAQGHTTADTAGDASTKRTAKEVILHISKLKPFNLAILAWAFRRLLVQEESVLEVLARTLQQRVQEPGSQEPSNAAWEHATLRVCDEPLSNVLADCAIQKHRTLLPQHLANAAQGPSETFAWRDLLTNALPAASSVRIRCLRYGDLHALLWSSARGLSMLDLWELFESCMAQNPPVDVLDIGVMLFPCAAVRAAPLERRVWQLIASRAPLRRDMQEIVARSTGHEFNPEAFIDRLRVATDLAGTQVSRHGGHAQHKLSMLVQFVEARVATGPSASSASKDLISAVLDFSKLRPNYWLKVAGDAKATLIDCILAPAEPGHRIRLEFGAYVGFSTLRLCNIEDVRTPRWQVQSLEVDPLHVCVARHLVNLGQRSQFAEVCAGQVKDLLPRMLEDFGSSAAALVFMDHRGTRFHLEFQLLERLKLFGPTADVLCDNVLHPGAPLYLWQESQPLPPRQLCVWSLPEFGGDSQIEDWMAHQKYQPFHPEEKVFCNVSLWLLLTCAPSS